MAAVDVLSLACTPAQKASMASPARSAWSAVVARLAAVTVDLEPRIVARQVLSPRELESEYGLAGGHLHHGEHALDQLLFTRPATGWARYATPIRGLWLGGSGAHPGGGIMGAPGQLCAERMLREGAV